MSRAATRHEQAALFGEAIPERADELESVTGLVALGRLIFGCGLPGWAIVRWVFNFIEKNRNAEINEVAKEVKEVL